MLKPLVNFLKFLVPPVIVIAILIGLKPSHEVNQEASPKAALDIEQIENFGDLQIHLKEKTAPGYVLYPSVGDYKVRILNSDGEAVHTWDVDSDRTRLMPDCSILVVHGTKKGKDHPHWGKMVNTVRRYSWDGEIIWEYHNPQRIHHDISVTDNGNYLMLLKTDIDTDMFRPYRDIPQKIKHIRSDDVIEVNTKGRELWRWAAHENLELGSCGRLECSEQHNKVGWTHMNTVREIPENKWYRAGDKRFKPGNVIVMLRNWWQAMIIDKDTSQVVWTYSGDYRGGLSGGHEAYMIPEGLPGEGNILIFDNGRMHHKGESIVLEVDPVSEEVVWKYEDGTNFFSHSAGSAQRLPNGNTFISEDADGFKAFEVTPEGQVVWQFQGVRRIARAYKYPPNYCPQLENL